MIYGYIRTSTDKQNNENQRFEIEQFAENNSLRVDKWVQETISSRKNLDERKLGLLLKKIKQDDIIIASELSRLGRNLLQIMSILHHCMNIGCQVWTIKDNYKLGADIQSKVLAFAFGLSAEIERNLISQRTKRCLDRLRAEGKHIGRKKGSKNKLTKLTGKDGLIKTLLSQNIQKKQIAKI
ncbi:MAG: master DNA invertase Mpi family serine-type recombinase [Alphaproteobacteria bacterium]|nr:master DNA invertase Mpi family serine-type recombinase [Alphaproteobacteria bacterium]